MLRPKLRLFKKESFGAGEVRKGKRVRFGPKAEIKAAFCNTGVVEVCATEREVGVVRPETWLEKWPVAPEKNRPSHLRKDCPQRKGAPRQKKGASHRKNGKEWKRKKEQLHKKNKQGGREKR